MEKIIISYYENDAEKLHKMIDKILFKLRFNVDNQDFYSLGNEIFVDVISRYDSSKDFDGFLYSCLTNKFKTEMTRRNREKRKCDRNAVSLNSPIGEEDDITLEDTISDKNSLIENIFFNKSENGYSEKMIQYLSKLSILQREVLQLISIGFSPKDIINELHINRKQYEDCYKAIHSYRNTSILL